MKKFEEEKFTNERVQSTMEKREQKVKLFNETKRRFVDEYLKSNGQPTDELRKIARDYALLKKGINLDSAKYMEYSVPDDMLNLIFKAIKDESKDNFIEVYDRFLERKISGGEKKYVDSAYDDVKNAYHTYRKCNNKDWDCKDEQIPYSEMENAFLVLSKVIINPEEKYNEGR